VFFHTFIENREALKHTGRGEEPGELMVITHDGGNLLSNVPTWTRCKGL